MHEPSEGYTIYTLFIFQFFVEPRSQGLRSYKLRQELANTLLFSILVKVYSNNCQYICTSNTIYLNVWIKITKGHCLSFLFFYCSLSKRILRLGDISINNEIWVRLALDVHFNNPEKFCEIIKIGLF